MSDKNPFGFRIRRIHKHGQEPAPAQAAEPPAPPVEEETPPPAPVVAKPPTTQSSGGRFRSASALLSCIGAVAAARLTEEVTCRGGPQGQWWLEVPLACERIAPLVWAAGGMPFSAEAGGWREVPLSCDGETREERRGETLDLHGWRQVELAHLLAATVLRPGRYAPLREVSVILPGALGRWALRRALALGVEAELVSALRRPLQGAARGREAGVLLLHLRAPRGHLASSLVRALAGLPYAVVAQDLGLEERRLLVDIRYRAPLSGSLLAGMIPDGESWVLGPPDVGHWRLSLQGEPVDAATLLSTSTPLQPPGLPEAAAARLPEPLQVDLCLDPHQHRRADAVLLDEREMTWVRPFLVGRPVSERAFLLPGPRRWLLMAPGGLPDALPFGTPLSYAGPEQLYLEVGTDFFPPLPTGARRQVLDLSREQVVVLTRAGGFRFDVAHSAPAWALWAGEAPPLAEGLPQGGEDLLHGLTEMLHQAERQVLSPPPRGGNTSRGAQQPPVRDPEEVLELVKQAELAGNWQLAAELLETIGETGASGRLYERAARL